LMLSVICACSGFNRCLGFETFQPGMDREDHNDLLPGSKVHFNCLNFNFQCRGTSRTKESR
jgi:hypothetical protein